MYAKYYSNAACILIHAGKRHDYHSHPYYYDKEHVNLSITEYCPFRSDGYLFRAVWFVHTLMDHFVEVYVPMFLTYAFRPPI